MSFSQKICLAGKNQIAVSALQYLIKCGLKEKLVVCPNVTDNGKSNWQPSIIRFARELDIEVISLNSAQKIAGLLFISLEFDRIIQPKAFKTDRLYNIHFSQLPAYKGMYTSALPILHGAMQSGVTLHEIDQGIDTGPIIAQSSFHLSDAWTARDLYFAYMDFGLQLFCENFDRLMGTTKPLASAQPARGSSYFSRSVIDYKNVTINVRDTAEGIIRQLRAFSFREYQTPNVQGFKVGNWEILAEVSREKPGTVLEEDSEFLTLATVDYRLRLTRFCAWDWFALTVDSSFQSMNPAFINVHDPDGWTPLIRAAYRGDVYLCDLLLKAGADPNCPNLNGTTPLMYAASCPKVDEGNQILQTLLKFGANINQRDSFGRDLASYHPMTFANLKASRRELRY